MNFLNRLAPIGWGPPVSRKTAHKWRTRGWGFHAVRGGIDPEDHHFHPRFVGAVEVEGFLIQG